MQQFPGKMLKVKNRIFFGQIGNCVFFVTFVSPGQRPGTFLLVYNKINFSEGFRAS